MDEINCEKVLKLSEAKVGRKYLVVKIDGKGLVKRRIMDLGILPNSIVEVIRIAPLGDPIEILSRGVPISIRRSEASLIVVKEVK